MLLWKRCALRNVLEEASLIELMTNFSGNWLRFEKKRNQLMLIGLRKHQAVRRRGTGKSQGS